MLVDYNIGLVSGFFLVASMPHLRSRNLKMVCGALAVTLIMYALGLFTQESWDLYFPGLLILFTLLAIYSQGLIKMAYTTVAILLFSVFIS